MLGIDSLLFDQINIVLILVALLNFALGILIYVNGRKKVINKTYSLNIIAIVSWTIAMFLFRSSSADFDIFWCKVLYIVPTFIASSFLCFTYIFPSKFEKNVKVRCQVFLIINFLLVVLVAYSDLVILEVNRRPGLEKEIIFGPLYVLYFIYTLFFFSFGFYRLFKKYLKTQGLEKSQILYLVLGYALAANLAFVTNLTMPWMGYFFLNWLGQIFTIFMVGFTAYAVLRYRLMDIRVVVRKFFIYFGVAFFAYVFFYFLVWVYIYFFGNVFSRSSYIATILVAPVFVFIFYGLDRSLRFIARKYLFVSLYNYQETINKVTDELNHYIDLNKIINLIVDNIKKTMKLDRAGVLLIDSETKPIHYKIAKVVGFNEKNGISLVQDNFLTKYLEKTQKPLVRDEILLLARDARTKKEKESFKKLDKHMKKIEASLCLPVMSSKKLIGIIVLGAKISRDAYTSEDLELLSTLSKQAGTAIENAQLYKKVENFSKTLKQKVEKQTADIEEKSKYLEELLSMKSDFLRVVNHQLNTPLSVMRGYFSMLDEGSYTAKKALPAIKGGLERISQTVADFWDAYELEGERMRMEQQQVDITDVVNKLIPEKKNMPIARQRKLRISIKKPGFKVPTVWCDYKKIAHVISNLLDNAIYYTYKGSVTVEYEMEGDKYLKINVKDTGAGISKEDAKKLFQKFSRGKTALGMHPDGSGLGLYIARKIVEGNDGELTVFSKGEGKGSTFSFTVPIYKNQKNNKSNNEIIARGKKIEIF